MTPDGFTLAGIGGGFTAWAVDAAPLEFRVVHHLTGSAPVSLDVTALVEVSHETLTLDHPAEAVAVMEGFGLIGGDNGDSGALSWHFDTAAEAVEWVNASLDEMTFFILSRAALGVGCLTDCETEALLESFRHHAAMFGGWHGVFDILRNLEEYHTSDDPDRREFLLQVSEMEGRSIPPLALVRYMLRAVGEVCHSTPTVGDWKRRSP